MFRYSILGTSHIGLSQIIYSIMATIITLCAGLLLFNRNEDKLIDII
jgi:ABC-type polysaccharide/polyol phosphate export permease